MTTIILTDRKIYRADNGKKVKFENDDKLYSEISVKLDDTRNVEEVENGDL